MFYIFSLAQKIDSRKPSRLLIGTCLTELTFLKEIRMFSGKLDHHWKYREQKEDIQTILIIMFWTFTML